MNIRQEVIEAVELHSAAYSQAWAYWRVPEFRALCMVVWAMEVWGHG